MRLMVILEFTVAQDELGYMWPFFVWPLKRSLYVRPATAWNVLVVVIKPVLSSSASVMTEMVSPFHRVPALFVLPPNVVTHPLPGKTLSGHGISTSVDVAWAGAAAATASTGTAQADAFASVRRLMALFSCTVIYPPADAGLKTV